MISRFPIFTTRRRQSHGAMGQSVRRTSSVTMQTASSSIAAGSTKAAQIRLARGRPESLSRPCVRSRPPVWRRLTKRRLSAARSNGRTHKTEPLLGAPPAMRLEAQSKARTYGLLSDSPALVFEGDFGPLHESMAVVGHFLATLFPCPKARTAQ